MLSNTIVKALDGTDILKYRIKLCNAIFAVGVSLPTTYDVGFYRGMEHALTILDNFCNDEFKKALNKKFGGAKDDI